MNWKDLKGRPELQRLHPAMLSESGYVIRKLALSKTAKWGQEAQLTDVIFDRSFVIHKLTSEFFYPLNLNHPRDLIKVLSLLFPEEGLSTSGITRENLESLKRYKLRGEDVVLLSDLLKLLEDS